MKNSKIVWMAEVAMLSAVSLILMLVEFPIPFIAPPFYEMDFSEVPVLVGTFAIGPLAGIVIETIKVLLNLLVNGTITGGIGELGNLLVGLAYIIPAGLIYKYRKNKTMAIVGLAIGSFSMVFLSSFINTYLLIPAYGKALGIPVEAFVEMGRAIHPSVDSLWKMVLLCTVPFNILKVFVVSVIVAFIYKPLSPILKGFRR